MTGQLEGRSALVTGASRGIGKAIATAFAAEGAEIAIHHHPEQRRQAEAAASAIAATGGKAFAVEADLLEEAQIKRMVKDAVSRLGGLDILVNNAGVMLERPLFDTTAADFDRVVGVNLRAVFLVGREAIRPMAQAKSGRVINIASELGILGRGGFSAYCASKGGVIALTRAWAREFGPDILVNTIAPGPIDTDMLSLAVMSAEWIAKEIDIPLRRVGRPEEIASTALFLAGPGATYITGQCFGPNGGAVMT
jgi:3-oxoacyl-[acyl-carrier protein] reductase